MSTLTYDATDVELPDALDWADELGWPAVTQSTTYTLTGALIVESAAKQTGRRIELAGDEQRAWLPRSVLMQLREWAAIAGARMTLLLRGTTYTVIWDHEAGAIEARPVMFFEEPEPEDHYVVTLRFIQVPAP